MEWGRVSGAAKLLAPYHGGVLIDGAVRAAMAAPVSRIIVATGHDGDAVAEAVRTLAARDHPGRTVDVVYANRHREGLAATLCAGIVALSDDVDGAFVFLGDMPRIPLCIAAELASGIAERAAAAPVFKGRRGHPVLFAARLFPALSQLGGDRGAGGVLDRLGDDLALIAVDNDGVLFDVDRPSDLAL